MSKQENDDRAALLKRTSKADFAAVEQFGDPDDLTALVDFHAWFSRQLKLTAVRIADKKEYSLSRIALGLRMTKQSLYAWTRDVQR